MKEKFIPSVLEFILCLVISLMIGVIGNTTSVLGILQENIESNLTLESLLSRYGEDFLIYIGSFRLTSDIVLWLFWSLVGLISYTIIEGIIKLYSALNEDMKISFKYVHPAGFKLKQFWLSVLANTTIRIFYLTLAVLWLVVLGLIFIPVNIQLLDYLLNQRSLLPFVFFISSLFLLTLGLLMFLISLNLIFKGKVVT